MRLFSRFLEIPLQYLYCIIPKRSFALNFTIELCVFEKKTKYFRECENRIFSRLGANYLAAKQRMKFLRRRSQTFFVTSVLRRVYQKLRDTGRPQFHPLLSRTRFPGNPLANPLIIPPSSTAVIDQIASSFYSHVHQHTMWWCYYNYPTHRQLTHPSASNVDHHGDSVHATEDCYCRLLCRLLNTGIDDTCLLRGHVLWRPSNTEIDGRPHLYRLSNEGWCDLSSRFCPSKSYGPTNHPYSSMASYP